MWVEYKYSTHIILSYNDLSDFLEIRQYNSEYFDLNAGQGTARTVSCDTVAGKTPLIFFYDLIGSRSGVGNNEKNLTASPCRYVGASTNKYQATFYITNTSTGTNFVDLQFSYFVLYINDKFI